MRFEQADRRVLTRVAAVLAVGTLAACGTAVGYAATTATTATTVTTGIEAGTMTPRAPSVLTAELSGWRHDRRATHRVVASTTTSTSTTTSLPPLAAPGPGLVAGRVTALGDSVMIDAQPDLVRDVPGIDVEAFVGEQWYQGVQEAQTLWAEGRLGAVVVVALGTNGPISQGDLAAMMQACKGASRVVFVTNHVPDPWQNPNNAIIASAPSQYPNAVVADWEALAAQNPGWFYSDGTHMPIGGPGAVAYASLVASKI